MAATLPRSARAERRRARAAAERSRTRKVLIGLLGTLVVVAGLVIGLGTLQVENVAEDVDRIDEAFPPEEERPAEATNESLTFLVLGVDPSDVATGATRAEAALLLRLTGDRQHAQVISLPLDTWVSEQGTTIEGAFGSSGPAGAVSAVETLTDVRIDHYAELDYGGFASLVDTLGGIAVDVPEPYSNRGYDFGAGSQQMDGAQALAYVRDVSADSRIGAPARQQRVVQALFDRIQERGAFADLASLGGLLDSVTDTVRVDESLVAANLVAMAWEFRGVPSPQFLSVPMTGAGTEVGEAVQYVDRDRAAALWGHLRDDELAKYIDEFL